MNTARCTFSMLLAVGLMWTAGCDLAAVTVGDGENGPGMEEPDGNDNGDDTVDARFARFTDPADPTFSTADVRDVDEEIVRFDTTDRSIVWAADGTAYQVGSWTVNGNFLGTNQAFQVRFGTRDGERRAYFTETGPATICQIEPVNGSIRISATSQTVPQE